MTSIDSYEGIAAWALVQANEAVRANPALDWRAQYDAAVVARSTAWIAEGQS